MSPIASRKPEPCGQQRIRQPDAMRTAEIPAQQAASARNHLIHRQHFEGADKSIKGFPLPAFTHTGKQFAHSDGGDESAFGNFFQPFHRCRGSRAGSQLAHPCRVAFRRTWVNGDPIPPAKRGHPADRCDFSKGRRHCVALPAAPAHLGGADGKPASRQPHALRPASAW